MLRFVADALGVPATSARDLSWAPDTTRVLELELADGGRAVLKLHRTVGKHRREVSAYRAWGPSLEPELPRLLAVRDVPPRAIVLEALPGRVAAETWTEAPATVPATVHAAAGAWLARLHLLPAAAAGSDPLPLDDAYRRRADAAVGRASAALDPSTRRTVEALLAATLPMLGGRPRVPCHRDFTPRNWLVRGGRWVAALDLEHARADLAEADLARLASGPWAVRPGSRAAFMAGYRAAGGPADPDAPWLPGLRALDAVATIGWAARHDDATLEADGRRALATVLDAPR
ncbi:MAG: aminoglycoside phosphotransferase family protein [Trueperaceae bacterium]|nr:aminoglycoside phosphotransferase family protein [Trueperaceae bacterium]